MKFKTFMSVIFSNGTGNGLCTDVANEVQRWRRALRTQTISEVIHRLSQEGSPEGVTSKRRRNSAFQTHASMVDGDTLVRCGRIKLARVMQVLHMIVGLAV